MLLAVDGNQRVVGANRVGRTSLLLDDRGLQAGISLWTIFDRDAELFRRKDSSDIVARLVIAGSTDRRSALVGRLQRSDPISTRPRRGLTGTGTRVFDRAPA